MKQIKLIEWTNNTITKLVNEFIKRYTIQDVIDIKFNEMWWDFIRAYIIYNVSYVILVDPDYINHELNNIPDTPHFGKFLNGNN